MPSTMEIAHELAAQGAVHGTAVRADRQSAGRGTHGRAWQSGDGGLWMSVVVRPVVATAIEALSVRVGAAVADALEQMGQPPGRIMVKWPNDLVAGGRKLGGILCEARWSGGRCQWVVIGLGLNVRNRVDDMPSATSLALLGARISVPALARHLAGCIADAARTAGPLDAREVGAANRRLTMRGWRAAAPVAGIVEGVGPTGALRVRDDEGRLHDVLAGLELSPR